MRSPIRPTGTPACIWSRCPSRRSTRVRWYRIPDINIGNPAVKHFDYEQTYHYTAAFSFAGFSRPLSGGLRAGTCGHGRFDTGEGPGDARLLFETSQASLHGGRIHGRRAGAGQKPTDEPDQLLRRTVHGPDPFQGSGEPGNDMASWLVRGIGSYGKPRL